MRFIFSTITIISTMLFPFLSQSATFTVDLDGNGDFTTVGEAVQAAFANSEADEIVINPGTYLVDDFLGETLTFMGEDEIVVRGSDPEDRPVIPVEPNFDVGGDALDGVVIQMSGSLTFENLIFIPTETFALEVGVDDLIAVDNVGTEGNPSTLDLTFRNVVVTNSTLDNTPGTLTGFEDPRDALNTLRDDGINIFTAPEAPTPPDQVNLTLEHVVISGYGTDTGSDGLVLDGPNIDATIGEGCRFTYLRRRGIFSFNANSLTIQGTDENPVIVWGTGETMARAVIGENNWSHLWCIGMQEGEGDLAINTGWGLRLDPGNGGSLIMENCIFANAINDGAFMNFGTEEPISYQFNNCTFYNVPQMIRFGFVGEPGPSENVTLTAENTIVDNADWTAPGGDFFAPEPTVVDFGNGDDTLAQVSLSHFGYRAETLVSSRSGSREITSENVIEVTDFQFAETEFNPTDFSDFLVVTNCDALGSAGSEGSPLGGARPTPCSTSVEEWDLF